MVMKILKSSVIPHRQSAVAFVLKVILWNELTGLAKKNILDLNNSFQVSSAVPPYKYISSANHPETPLIHFKKWMTIRTTKHGLQISPLDDDKEKMWLFAAISWFSGLLQSRSGSHTLLESSLVPYPLHQTGSPKLEKPLLNKCALPNMISSRYDASWLLSPQSNVVKMKGIIGQPIWKAPPSCQGMRVYITWYISMFICSVISQLYCFVCKLFWIFSFKNDLQV